MAQTYNLVSVGTHVNPPPAMWRERVAAPFRARAPRLGRKRIDPHGEVEVLVFEGREFPCNLIAADAGKRSEDLRAVGRTFRDGHQGGWDPDARLKDQALDGVDVDVIFDGVIPLYTEDLPLKFALMQAYNDWLSEFCATAPEHFLGVAELPMWDMKLAASEAQRARKIGLRGALIPAVPGIQGPYSSPAHHQYNDPFYGPLWSVLEELDMPAHIHLGTQPLGKGLESDTIISMSCNKSMLSEPIAVLACSGVLERHPKLKLVCVESGVGWMAYFVPWMDLVFERHRHYTNASLDELPSFYFHRQVYGTYIQDLVGIRIRDLIGIENIMWCNDYPHADGIWPHSRDSIEEHMAGVPENERRAILAGNAVNLYGLR